MKRFSYWFCVVVRGAALILIAVYAAVKDTDAKALQATHPLASQLLLFSLGWAWVARFPAQVAAGVAHVGVRMIGPPWVADAIRSQLDAYHALIFGERKSDPVHHNRVTLFKHRRFCLEALRWKRLKEGWKANHRPIQLGWLVPVERSNYVTKGTCPTFLACDRADAVEGIAGRAWLMKAPLSQFGLPAVGGEPPAADKEIVDYAKASFVTEAWVRENKPTGRAFVGMAVEAEGAKPWGVIVIDSRRPEEIPVTAQSLSVIVKSIGQLLTRS